MRYFNRIYIEKNNWSKEQLFLFVEHQKSCHRSKIENVIVSLYTYLYHYSQWIGGGRGGREGKTFLTNMSKWPLYMAKKLLKSSSFKGRFEQRTV